jgi:hypothetical protein
MSTAKASPQEIQDAIVEFTDGLDAMQKQSFNKVFVLLKELTLDADGKIEVSVENLKLIQKINNALDSFVDSPLYQDKVSALQGTIDKVQSLQTDYYSLNFAGFTVPDSIDEINSLTFDNVVDQLTEAGINENVVGYAQEIVEQHIRDGSNFSDLVSELKDKMLGDKDVEPRLVSYAKQTINDTLSNFSRNYHNIVTSDLGLEWYVYVGALVDSSRPFCIAMVDKHYVHKSEFTGCITGNLLGLSTSQAHEGMMVGTNKENLINRCGGWNCNHQLVPVPTSTVPKSLTEKFKDK